MGDRLKTYNTVQILWSSADLNIFVVSCYGEELLTDPRHHGLPVQPQETLTLKTETHFSNNNSTENIGYTMVTHCGSALFCLSRTNPGQIFFNAFIKVGTYETFKDY